MIEKSLRAVGFSDKEIEVYFICLELGTAKASEIAKESTITRTTIYDILKSLVKKGLINKHKKGAATFYAPLEPERLLSYIDREIEDTRQELLTHKKEIERFLPELRSRQNVSNTKPKVRFFEGEKGMREAYEETLSADRMILAYANVQTMHDGLPNFFPTYYQRRADADIFIRTILPRNALSFQRAEKNLEEKRDTRFLPEDETFSPEVNIFGNNVLIASWKEKMAIIIESQEFADFHRTVFEQLWERLPKS